MISTNVPAMILGNAPASLTDLLSLAATGVLLALLALRYLASSSIRNHPLLDRVFSVALLPLVIMFAIIALARITGL